MNGKIIEKFKDPKTTNTFEDQFGGKSILQEGKDSKYIFIFGRYHFDDIRQLISYAGHNAWNRTLSDKEMESLSDCETVPNITVQGNLLSNETAFSYPCAPANLSKS